MAARRAPITWFLFAVFQLNVLAWKAPLNTFRVSAFSEHAVSYTNITSREDALKVMYTNLESMEQTTMIAKGQGADVIVFAEYGITGFMLGALEERASIYPYMEHLPPISPDNYTCYRCGDVTPGREAQSAVGCIAAKYEMYVVANLIEAVPCSSQSTHKKCPSDGHYQYNTNIIFNKEGCLIAKYHKYHRYQEEQQRLDGPAEPEYVYFDTEFGRFGTIICMDSIYKEPGITLVEKYNVEHMLFPTAWDNTNDFVYMLSTQWQLAFASRMNVSFIAANIQNAVEFYEGSGIYKGTQTIDFDFDTKDNNSKLLIGDLPIGQSVYRREDMSKLTAHQQYVGNYDLFNYKKLNLLTTPGAGRLHSKVHTVTIYNDTYNAVVLTGKQGEQGICQNSFCCTVDYIRNNTNETYILGATKRLHHKELKMRLESCVLYKCENTSLKSCATRQNTSETSFGYLKLSGHFSTEYVFPTILPSGFAFKNLEWSFERPSTYETEIFVNSQWPLVSASLIGRVFKEDPLSK